MQDAVGAAPSRQHPDKRTGSECVLAIPGRQQRNPGALACRRHQNVEATTGKARLYLYAADITIFSRQMPGAAALFFLVQHRKIGKVRWRHRNTRRQQVRACDQDAPAYADPLYLQLSVGVETFPNADRNIDPLVNQVDPTIGCDALDPQLRVGGKEARQGTSNRALKSERAAQPNKPARLGLHSKRGLLGRLGLDNCSARMFEDLLADLGQTKASRRPIKKADSEALLQQRDTPTDA
ncbi:MAG TPA: hypothetical protein VE267_09385 [Bradyrhizobium sp.]|nr:hypothetical protein [Bradyrhizobium sp.]